jgi:hypothetical protein
VAKLIIATEKNVNGAFIGFQGVILVLQHPYNAARNGLKKFIERFSRKVKLLSALGNRKEPPPPVLSPPVTWMDVEDEPAFMD